MRLGSRCFSVEWMRRRTVIPAYNDIGLYDTSSIASDIVAPIYFSRYIPLLQQHSVITTQNIQSLQWRYNRAKLYTDTVRVPPP